MKCSWRFKSPLVRNLSGVKSTLVLVMAWCRQATSHYLSQCWRRSLSSYTVTRPPLLFAHGFAERSMVEVQASFPTVSEGPQEGLQGPVDLSPFVGRQTLHLFLLVLLPTVIWKTWWRHDMETMSTSCDWPFVRGIHWSLVDSPHKGPVMRSFDLMSASTSYWTYSRNAGDLRRHDAHYIEITH